MTHPVFPHIMFAGIGHRVIIALLMLLTLSTSAAAQSATDGTTPAGAQPGAPAGSYSLSGFDTVNYFNGNLNFSLPLIQVGGRGGGGITIPLKIEQRWTMFAAPHSRFYARAGGWQNLQTGYGAGTLEGRVVGLPDECDQGAIVETLARLTFTAPDGTEYELRDALSNGASGATIYGQNCVLQGTPFRGRVFKSSDGSAVTFVSDTDITDANSQAYLPSGYMLMPNGARYRIEAGKVSWVRDRNGNRTEYEYDALNRTSKITDSLGRTVTFRYRNQTGNNSEEIIYAGVAGVTRTIHIWYQTLNALLHTGHTLKTYRQLFPELNATSTVTYFDPDRVSSVELPDGRSYGFKYNSYGELARVVLPTGGAFEYDFEGGLAGGTASGVMTNNGSEIYRRVVERRVYPDGATGGAYASRMTVSKPEPQVGANTGYVTVEQRNPAGALLSKEAHYYHGSAAGSFSPDPLSYGRWKDGREWKSEVFDTYGTTVLRRSEQTWQQPVAGATWPLTQAETSDAAKPNDPQVTQRVSTVEPSGANLVSKQTFAYDGYHNRTDVYEYGFGTGTPGALLRRSQTNYLTTHPASGINYASPTITATSIHLRNLPTRQSVYDAAGTEQSRQTFEYDNYATDAKHATLVARSGITGLDAAFTSSYETRGNVTGVSGYLLSNGSVTGSITTYRQYDVAGNVVKSIDGRDQVSEVGYADAFSDNTNRNTFAYPTLTTSPVPDPSNNRATNTPLVSASVYDFSTGKVTSTTDANNQVTYLRYKDDNNIFDPLDQPRRVEHPDGGVTKYNYSDAPGDLYMQTISYRGANQTNPVESRQYFDGLGRQTRAFLYDGTAATPWTVTDTHHDAVGRVWKTSNPYRAATPSATLPSPSACTICTTTAYDALGRVRTVTTPDNAVVTTDYSGAQVTVTDQRGKVRRSASDAFGRLTHVTEPNGAGSLVATDSPVTNYTYDVMGNLRKVDQGGQLRYFMYDSLGRLVRARNPEQATNASLALQDSFKAPEDAAPNSGWTLKYTYDANGNLETRTDARGVTTTYQYDNINRLKQTTYSDSTPFTLRTYDFAANGRGRHYADYESSTSGTINYVTAYDAMGRATAGKTEFYLNGTGWLPAYPYSRSYDKMGHVTQQGYPSGHVVNYTQFDAAGRLKEFSGNLGDGTTRTYSAGIEYDEASRMKLEQFGTQTALDHRRAYNVRGQMCEVGLGSQGTSNRGLLLFYYSQVNGYSGCGSGTDNNGNVVLSQHWVPNDPQAGGWQWFNQYYTYDSLNRIGSVREEQNAATTTGEQHYIYDRWGNRQIDAAATYNNNPALPFNEKQFNISTATNRLSVPTGQAGAMAYDAAGNLTTDSYTGAGARTYDAENRMTSAVTGINSSSVYTYDANGKRVRRSGPNGNVWQIYGLDGELLSEYAAATAPSGPQKEYGYRSGELLVTAEGVGTSATFVKIDATTGGNWKGNYGAEGYNLVGDGASHPAYAQVSATGNSSYIWAASTTDVRAMQKAAQGSADRIAATYFSATEYTIDINLTDGKMHRVALYCLDWDGNNIRAQRLEVRDAATNALLDSREVSAFSGGQYVVWNLRGHVKVKVIYTGPAGLNAVASGLFFDPSPDVVQWLVTDTLGTPRIVADLSGSLVGIKRHDYLPFGEKLGAGVGGRTSGQGYSQPDGVQQGFTGYEKDGETGLNFAQARYHSPTMGRFTSPDSLLESGDPGLPQSWNRYTYVLNNPLLFVDPTGLIWGYKDLEDGRRQFAWCAGDAACEGYEPYTDATYRFGDGRSVWLNQEEGTWGVDEPIRPDDSCLYCSGLINEMAQRGPAMEKMILTVVALNAAPAVVSVGSGALAGGSATTLGLEAATTRTLLLNSARDPRLINLINYLYRQGATVGNGGTAAALAHEIKTGELLSPAGHAQKAQGAIVALERLVGKLGPGDRQIAEKMINSLKEAMKTQK